MVYGALGERGGTADHDPGTGRAARVHGVWKIERAGRDHVALRVGQQGVALGGAGGTDGDRGGGPS